MAIRYAVANGNWSNTATWNGGTLPASTDDVYANNFTVNIDQSVTVNSLKKISNASPAITAGGTFVVTAAATVTITANISASDNVTNSTALLSVNAGSAAVTINSAVTAAVGSNRIGVQVESGYTGTLTLNGNLTGGDASSDGRALNVLANSCTINITGAISGVGGYGVYIVGTAPVITITGAVSSGNAGGNGILSTSSSATVTVNGNVTGGTSTNGYGIFNNLGASAVFIVNGTVTGGTASACYGVYSTGTSATVTVSGGIAGGTSAYGIYMTAGFLRLDALLKYGTTGCAPVHCQGAVPQFKHTGSNLGMQAPSDDNWPSATGTPIIVQRYTTGNPAPADVRAGTAYGPGGTSTGTLAVPPAASVAAGVPVDATTGTAALKLADVLAGTGGQIAAVFP